MWGRQEEPTAQQRLEVWRRLKSEGRWEEFQECVRELMEHRDLSFDEAFAAALTIYQPDCNQQIAIFSHQRKETQFDRLALAPKLQRRPLTIVLCPQCGEEVVMLPTGGEVVQRRQSANACC